MRAEVITSAANPLVKDVRRAMARGTPTAEGCCVAETFHLLEEALGSGCEVPAVLAAESARARAEGYLRRRNGIKLAVLPDKLFAALSDTETSQGVMALVKPPAWKIEQLFSAPALVVVLDGVQDPGNAGTVVRTAEAFGASGVLILKGSVAPFNAKTLRASAGSLFRVPFLHGLDAEAARAALRQHQVELYAGVPARQGAPGCPPAEADFRAPCAIVVGSEGRGVSRQMRGAAREVTIPTVRVESLNAAVAAAILLYEAHRQRGVSP